MKPHGRSRCTVVLSLLLALAFMSSKVEGATDMFPFLINPFQVSPDNITNVSIWLDKPAGKHGFVRVENGHFVTGDGQRLRFLGVNLTFDGNFPDHASAERLARQLARFGINLVRFHHMDMSNAPRGIWQAGVFPRRFDPGQLDRLDYLVAKLKENGIYSNFNLHVSRTMQPQEGFPSPELRPSYDKGLDMYHPGIIAALKEFARELLTHRNPYTGNRYIEEPALAMVEITNEDGFIRYWEQGEIDSLPASYLAPLDEQWQEWLQKRYQTTEALRAAWGGVARLEAGEGPELATNGSLLQGKSYWSLELDTQAQATMDVVDAAGPHIASGEATATPGNPPPALRVQVQRMGLVSYRPQFYHTRLKLEPGKAYILSFWVKADKPRQVRANVKMQHAPWSDLWTENVTLTDSWQRHQYLLRIPAGIALQEARVGLTSLEAGATYWVAGVSLRELAGAGIGLPAGESLEQGVTRPRRSELGVRTPQVQRDYISFLWDVEDAYFTTMYNYLKEDLGVRAAVSGTQVRWSAPAIQAKLDYVDSHAYWNHPVFPNNSWDARDWYVQNNSMVTATDGGNISRLAATRVAGKPYVVSEYNHPAPITFSQEAFLLTGAYGSFQDWDGLVAFEWSNNSDFWSMKIPSFFAIKSHPTKLVTLPAVAALFLRGDVTPGSVAVSVPFDTAKQKELLLSQRVTTLATDSVGVPGRTALNHRLELVVDGAAPGQVAPAVRPANFAMSDTGELQWDSSAAGRGVVLVNTPRSKAVIGYGGNRSFDLSGVRINPGPTQQNGWGVITLTVMEGDDFTSPGRILLTASGYAENAGMKWEKLDGDKVTVRDQWGQGPPMVEGIPARIELPVSAEQVRVYALDQIGDRREEIAVQAASGGDATRSVIEIGPEHRTLWYEIEIISK